ncbi:sulfotransferase domain-containing protein [Thalassomonas actiniarum]|uniref:Sulfotransferase domain-containing protein n=1 Tax=Thalassomonas actiniarum TaxID=485447 RepID=A0AAF0C0R6_9GAMM|nr:sulfotransferase domain-containing protein [Thalassomonas actiniarum]WDD98526.1 sulfotransferase domain-containing protein [Thalassomonas actiniarum]
MKNYACFIVSTGRCGTQWLTRHLPRLLTAQQADNYQIKHEPLGYQYAPIDNSPSLPLVNNKALLEQHLNEIRNTLSRGKNYIETGFPCWRHIAWFAQELEHPVKVIHLTRHPVFTAISWLKLNAFVPPALPHLPEKELFTPFAPGARLPEYQQNWQHLSPFEKCLYFWAEVQLQALAFEQDWQEKHWLHLSYESLFTGQSLNKLAAFLATAAPDGQLTDIDTSAIEEKTDSYGHMVQTDFEPQEIFRHPEIVNLAKRLGYRELAIDKHQLPAKELLSGYFR